MKTKQAIVAIALSSLALSVYAGGFPGNPEREAIDQTVGTSPAVSASDGWKDFGPERTQVPSAAAKPPRSSRTRTARKRSCTRRSTITPRRTDRSAPAYENNLHRLRPAESAGRFFWAMSFSARRAASVLCLIVAQTVGALIDGVGSNIEAGPIPDVSLTTWITQRTTLHVIIIQPTSHDHTCSGRLQGAARTNHETVQASPELGSSEQHPQRTTVPLHEQREHRHPQDVRELPTQRIKAKAAERRDERSECRSTRRRRLVRLCRCDHPRAEPTRYNITKRKMNMLTRFTQRLGLWISVSLLAAATGGVAMAEAPVRADEGKVEAIEIYRAPDNYPVNGGTVIGGIAGGVIGHQIGSGRGNTAATIAGAIGGAVLGNEIEKKQGQATAIPHHRATRFGQLADRRRHARPQPAGGRPRADRRRPHLSDLSMGSCR